MITPRCAIHRVLPKLDYGQLVKLPLPFGITMEAAVLAFVCKIQKTQLLGLQDVGIRTICLVWYFFN